MTQKSVVLKLVIIQVLFFYALLNVQEVLAFVSIRGPWKGQNEQGDEITEEKLNKIIRKHKKWLAAKVKERKLTVFVRAKLDGIALYYEEIPFADFYEANIQRAWFEGCDLSRAIFDDADLKEAIIYWTNFKEANFSLTNLSKSETYYCNFQGALFYRSNLKEANFHSANFKNTIFEPEPGHLPNIPLLVTATNLSQMTYDSSPHGLVELREAFKKAGMRQQEREMTFAIKHNERIKESGWLWSGFQYAFFELPVGWGLYPGRALITMACLIPFFTVFYYFPLGLGTWRGGTIWMRWREGRAANLGEPGQPRPLKRQGWRRVAFAFYFSLLSAFHIGWRELNVGNWITRMQPREYTLQATGWPRVISGVQSLISVYLLALAVLSYFGRPFE